MAYTTIDDPSAYFQTALYTGNGSNGNAIVNDGLSDLQPDFIMQKRRDAAYAGRVWDSSRTPSNYLTTQATDANADFSGYLASFDTDGFTVNYGDNSVNNSGSAFVAWQWHCNSGSSSSNTDGSITSTVQVNSDAGFSIVRFTGNGSNDATIGHGLGVTPGMIITKNMADSVSWRVWHQDLTSTYTLFINATNAETSPTGQGNGYIKTVGSSTYSVYQGNTDTNGVNGSGDNMVAYCFAEKQGYSKFGKYKGLLGTTRPVYTGFKPAFIMIKNASASASWHMFDTKREGYNPDNDPLYANLTNAEATADEIDIYSNGFRVITNDAEVNGVNNTIVYMAFAESPFVTSTGIPTTAR